MTKTISLSDDAYHALSRLKDPGESFSDVALRLFQRYRQERILSLAGAWEMSEAEADELKASIHRIRDESLEPRVSFE